jgi:hypothetical protein
LLGTGTTVLVNVGLHCLFGVASSVNYMTRRHVGMVCRRFVTSSVVVLGSFLVMMSRMRKVF